MAINPNEYLKALEDAFEQEAQKYFDSLSAEVQEKVYRLKDLDQTYDNLDIFSQSDIDTIHKVKFFSLFLYRNESLSDFLKKLHAEGKDDNVGNLIYELKKIFLNKKIDALRNTGSSNLKLQLSSEAERIINEVRTKLQNQES